MSARLWWYNVFGCAQEGEPCTEFYKNCADENNKCFSLAEQCDSNDESCYGLAGKCNDAHYECYSLWEQVHLAALIPATISVFCSIYIIYCTIKYRRQFSTMTFGALLPMFISICDIGFHTFHGLDHIHNIATGYVTENPWCLIFGATAILFINSQTMWECATGYFLNYCVRCQQVPKFGKYEWRLHAVCWSFPIIIYISGFIAELYGPEGAWCGVPNAMHHLFMLDLWLMLGMAFLLIIYLWTGCLLYFKMRKYFNDPQYDNSKIKRVLRTLPWFPLVYIFQWMPYILWKMFQWEQKWSETMYDVIVTNMGGMFNAIIFHRLLMNQVRKQKKKKKSMIRNTTEMESMMGGSEHTGTDKSGAAKTITHNSTQITETPSNVILVPNQE